MNDAVVLLFGVVMKLVIKDCGGGNDEGCGKQIIHTSTQHHRRRYFLVTGRAAHGRIGRLFQKLIKENAAAAAAIIVETRARAGTQTEALNSGSGGSWIDKSPYKATNTTTNTTDKGEEHQRQEHRQQESVGDHDDCNSSSNYSSSTAKSGHPPPSHHISFLWENAPQYNTRVIRDTVSCYSHLPFGILLDDKWALARLLMMDGKNVIGSGGCHGASTSCKIAHDGGGDDVGDDDDDDDGDAFKDPNLATLDCFCFRGAEFVKFAKRVGLIPTPLQLDEGGRTGRWNHQAALLASIPATNSTLTAVSISAVPIVADGAEGVHLLPRYQYEDLTLPPIRSRSPSSMLPSSLPSPPPPPPPPPKNLWVIKDAMSNGAGGIWIVDETNVQDFFLTENNDQHQDDVEDNISRVTNIDGNNPAQFMDEAITTTTTTSPLATTIQLHPTHRYVAQRYAWPPTLYNGRKCHVRVYALITCTGEAFIHRKAFLHVANELFAFASDEDDDDNNTKDAHEGGVRERKNSGKNVFHPSVHITNCCANSHDASKFAGEICVDLEKTSKSSSDATRNDDYSARNDDDDKTNISSTPFDPLPLGEYLPSISASVAALAQSFLPFLGGGEANGGFEYLGLDFVLSSVEEVDDVDESMAARSNGSCDPEIDMSLHLISTSVTRKRRRPVAYLLEVNAPPSQDTATGLQHAEDLHDEVIADLLRLWVLPNVNHSWSLNRRGSQTINSNANVDDDYIDHRCCGGWRRVYPLKLTTANDGSCMIMEQAIKSEMILPSKAAILNRIRWALFEKKATKENERMWNSNIGYNSNYTSNFNNNDADVDDINIGGSGGGSSRISNINEQQLSMTLLSSEESLPELYELSSTWRKKSVADDHLNNFVTFARSQFPYFSYSPPISRSENKRHAHDLSQNCYHDTTSSNSSEIFFESGGGAQVPKVVQNAVCWSLSHRDRSVVGGRLQIEARLALTSLLVRKEPQLCQEEDTSFDSQMIIMGPNASYLLAEIARRMRESGTISPGDEIIISSENHQANVMPWLKTARLVGASVKWWTVASTSNVRSITDNDCHHGQSSCILSDLITERTKVVAVSHVSNILGMERDIASVCKLVHQMTEGKGQVVVDGVAAAPHLPESYATSIEQRPDWYLVSLHKLFGPHLGCIVCKRSVLQMLHSINNDTVCGDDPPAGATVLPDDRLVRSWELGTMNYESCSGAIALHKYLVTIGFNAWKNFGSDGIEFDSHGTGIIHSSQPSNQITSESSNDHCGEDEGNLPTSTISSFYINIAGMCIYHVENRLIRRLLCYLQSCVPNVRIIQDVGEMKVSIDSETTAQEKINLRRFPIVCFLHSIIPAHRIVEHCRDNGVVCRSCKFLSTDRLWNEMGIKRNAEVVRFSLAHYNTLEEIESSIQILESLDGWN